MNAQWAIVAAVVLASAVYAAWTLMPATLRRTLAAAALKLPLPNLVAARMRAELASSSSCGCRGCDRNPLSSRTTGVAAPTVTQPITLHRRTRG